MVLPQEVRKRLSLKPSQKFEVEIMPDGTILLIPIPKNILKHMKLAKAEKLVKALEEKNKLSYC